MKLHDTIIMLVGMYTVGNIIMIPYAFGQLGVVGGPILFVIWAIAVYIMNRFVVDVSNDVSHLDACLARRAVV